MYHLLYVTLIAFFVETNDFGLMRSNLIFLNAYFSISKLLIEMDTFCYSALFIGTDLMMIIDLFTKVFMK